MKKIILTLSIFTLALNSCSNDETTDTPIDISSGILLKKTIDNDGVDVITTNYTYNGNKLVSISDDTGYQENFIYTGDLITSTQEYDNGGLYSTNTFEYNTSGKITFFKRFDEFGDEYVREGYNYNSDGTITIDSYDVGTFDINGNPYIFKKETLFFTNNEISKVVSKSYDSGLNLTNTSTRNFTYDTKNNPFINITGFEKFYFGEGDLYQGGINVNLLTASQVGASGSDVYQYTYNSSNFPVTSTYNYNSGGSGTIQYFY